MRPERNQNRIGKLGRRIVAICLLTACVLALIPTILGETIANWILRSESADKITLEGTAGTHSVQFHSFAENMPLTGDVTAISNYYSFDETATGTDSVSAGNYYIGASIANPSAAGTATKELTLAGTGSKDWGKYLCTHEWSEGTACNAGYTKYASSDAYQADFQFPATVLSLGNATSTMGTLDLEMPATSWENVDILVETKANTTSTKTGNSSISGVGYQNSKLLLEEEVEIDGVTYNRQLTLYATVSAYTSEYSTDVTVQYATHEKCYKVAFVINRAGDGYQCSVNGASCTTTYTYTAYIAEVLTPGASFGGTVTEFTASDAENAALASYTMNGLRVGDMITAPPVAKVKESFAGNTALNDADGKQDYIYTIIGYYTKNGDQYTPIALPILIKATTATTLEIWAKWGIKYSDDPIYDPYRKEDLNADLTTGGGTYDVSAGLNTSTKLENELSFTTAPNPDDPSKTDKIFYLSSNILSGTTLNFTMNDGRVEVNAGINDEPLLAENCVTDKGCSLTDTTASLSNNTRDYTVKLQNDIHVAAGATLTIAGYTGSYNNSTYIPTGYIIGNYVALDLNGKTLTVDGNLYSYGYIYDSVGTGKIVVNTTGTLYTPLLLFGMTGLQHTLKSYGMGYCPFEDYNMPYMETLVELKTENVNGTVKSATLYGMTMLYLQADIGMMNYYMKLFGAPTTGTDAPVFSLKPNTGSTGMATVEPTKVEMMSSDTSLTNQCINIKNIFTFENIYTAFTAPTIVMNDTIVMSGIEATIDTELNMGRVIFPISSMVDVTLHSSVFDMQQQIIVMPGATVTVDVNSTLKFSYYQDSNGTAAQKTFQDVSGEALRIAHIYYCSSATKYLSAGIFAPTYNVQNTTLVQTAFNNYKVGLSYGNNYNNFWKYYQSGTVNVYGNIEFESGNNADYVLSGNINVRKFKTPNSALMDWNATNLAAADWTGINMRTYGALGVPAISTTGTVGGGQLPLVNKGTDYQIAKMLHYFTLPMVSNGTAYLFDQGSGHAGTFDATTGIFAADNGKNYIILPGVDLPDYGDSPTDSSTETKGLITMNPTYQEVTTMHTDANGNFIKLVTAADGNQYAFYAGTYNKINAGSFDSTALTCTFDGANFYSGGWAQKNTTESKTYTGTLTWNATKKLWIFS